MLENRMSRREALGTMGKAAIGAGVVIVAGGAAYYAYTASQPAKPTKIHLDFTVWNYSVETIKANAEKFSELNPNIDVTVYDFNWPDFPSTMVKRFTQKTPTDVTYNGEDWLAQWAGAGWVVPLQDFWDKYPVENKFSDYVNDMVPFAKSSMTYNGKIYGLPYYSDMFTFMYNEQTLKENGIDQPPSDWDEVLDICLKLKQKGVATYPFTLQYQATNPFDFYVILSGAYGRGARLFDQDGNPIFHTPGSPFIEHLQWIVDGINKHKIINPDYLATHETDAQKKLGAGEGVFTLLAKYNLAAMNTPGQSPRAGQFRLALMPGKSHEAYGFAKMYNLTQMCVDRGDAAVEAAIKFIEYFGGSKGPVLKIWAIEKGLGFGYVSPYKDPDIAKAIDDLYGLGAVKTIEDQAKIAITEPHPVWFGQWIDYSIKEAMAKAFTKEITVQQCVDAMANKMNELKAG